MQGSTASINMARNFCQVAFRYKGCDRLFFDEDDYDDADFNEPISEIPDKKKLQEEE